MKPLDYTPITEVLQNFINNEFGVSLLLSNGRPYAEPDSDFFYYYESHRIGYSLLVSDRTQRLFPKYCEHNLGLQHKTPIFILAFLHELGHHYTTDLFDDSEIDEFEEIKEDLGDTDSDFLAYFDIEDEYEASKWAVDYIDTHPDKIKQLDLDLKKALDKFYEINGIEGD